MYIYHIYIMNIGEIRKAKEVRGLEPFLDDLKWGDEEI